MAPARFDPLHTILCLGGLALVIAGCATAASSLDAPAALAAPIPAGRYTGIMTGRELATASTMATARAELTIAPDGRWTMRAGNYEASGTVRRATPDLVVLDGRSPDGATASYEFAREDGDDFLVGPGPSTFGGHTVWAGFQLRRIDAPFRAGRPN